MRHHGSPFLEINDTLCLTEATGLIWINVSVPKFFNAGITTITSLCQRFPVWQHANA